MADSFGQVLRRLRRAVGLTQEELAARAGLSVQGIGALERGERRFPHQGTVDLLIAALDLSGERRRLLQDAVPRRSRPGAELERDGPRQLPLAVGDFTGRQAEQEVLTGLLAGAGERPAVVVAAVTGMGGVGKTTLAVQVGHRLAEQFPDGQLYIDLRGFGAGDPVSVPEALAHLLRGLGTAPDDCPADVDDAVARYRSVLAGQRVLVLIDNARDVAQVGPLLPGTAGCAVVVTSRRALSSLPGAHQLRLGQLTADEGLDLLRSLAGRARVDAEPAAAREVVDACGGLPLAIRIAGSRLAGRGRWPVSHLAQRLADERERLDELEIDDRSVRASLAVSVRTLVSSADTLDVEAARTFALLSLVDGTEISLVAAARLCDLTEPRAERLLERLADAHLLESLEPTSYRFHDLARAYAREFAAGSLPAEERSVALRRLLELYVAVIWRLRELSSTPSPRSSWADGTWARSAPPLADTGAGLAWIDREQAHLPGLVTWAAALGAEAPRDLVVGLALGLARYYSSRCRWHDWIRVAEVALELAGPLADRRAAAWLNADIGTANGHIDRGDEAVASLERAAGEFRMMTDVRAELGVLVNLTHVLCVLGRVGAGVECGRRAVTIGRELGDIESLGAALMVLGQAKRAAGEFEPATVYLTEACELLEQATSEWRLANCLAEVGELCQQTGRHDDALDHLSRSAELSRRIGQPADAAESLLAMADSHLALGSSEAALQCLDEAVPLAESEHADALVARIKQSQAQIATAESVV